ncbi:MAG: hypothetical protein AB7W28_03060 [Armatimonadota bacterium]
MNRSPTRGGFSSLEFGFVGLVIILLVLGSSAINFFARGAAKRISCASTLRQLAMAAHMYAADYAGRLPSTPEQLEVLAAIPKNQQLLQCPAAESDPDYRTPRSDYLFRLGAATDDPPDELIVWDDKPSRHLSDSWNAALLDGRVKTFTAEQFACMTAYVPSAYPGEKRLARPAPTTSTSPLPDTPESEQGGVQR